MLIGPNWHDAGTKAQVEGRIGNGFKVRIGWTETSTDSVYCTPLNDGYYRIQVWNDPDIRQKLAVILGMPVHREMGCTLTTSPVDSGKPESTVISSGKLKKS